jgi:hypothetical protein
MKNLNEEIINQLRLINFDRSKTILEQNKRKISIEGRIFNGIDKNPCNGCSVSLYFNNIDTNKVLKQEYYENKFFREVPLAKTKTTSDGYYSLSVSVEPGPYAITANGATTNDYTTVYFNVVKSGTYSINVLLAEAIKDLDEVVLWTPEMQKLQTKFNNLEKYYNDLMDSNWSDDKYTYTFPNPQKFADQISSKKDIIPYINRVQKAVNELKSKIKKGENYLKDAKKYVDVSGLKSLDVLRGFGSQNAYTIMNSLYSIGGNAVNVWREWNNNDGQFFDPNRYELSKEDIEYIKNMEGRKRAIFDRQVKSFVESYHEYSPYVALVLYFIPGGTWYAVGLEAVDAILYATYDENYYMAGLCVALTATGTIDNVLLMYPGSKKALATYTKKLIAKEAIGSGIRESVEIFIKNAGPKVISTTVGYAFKFILGFFKLMSKSVEAFFIGFKKLWSVIDYCPGWLKALLKGVRNMAFQVGGAVWTWDLIATYMGLCNTMDFSDASENWDDSEHWWITNLLLGDIIVPYMGWSQAWSEPCEKLQYLNSADNVISDLKSENKVALKDAANAEQRTKEQQELITSVADSIDKEKKLYRDSLDLAKETALKQWETDSTAVANQKKNDSEDFNLILIQALYGGGKELEKTTGLEIKNQ